MTYTDPAAQLAAVSALRAEFNAREAAKNLKFQQAEAKAREKEMKRREKRDESARRKSETQERKRGLSRSDNEKIDPLSAVDYNSTTAFPVAVDINIQGMEQERPTRPKRGRTLTGSSAGKAGKAISSHWSLFWFRFTTMWLKFKRNVGVGKKR